MKKKRSTAGDYTNNAASPEWSNKPDVLEQKTVSADDPMIVAQQKCSKRSQNCAVLPQQPSAPHADRP